MHSTDLASILVVDHAAAWAQLWKLATLELDTSRIDLKRAINSTLYAMLSLHDETDTTAFPASPLIIFLSSDYISSRFAAS